MDVQFVDDVRALKSPVENLDAVSVEAHPEAVAVVRIQVIDSDPIIPIRRKYATQFINFSFALILFKLKLITIKQMTDAMNAAIGGISRAIVVDKDAANAGEYAFIFSATSKFTHKKKVLQIIFKLQATNSSVAVFSFLLLIIFFKNSSSYWIEQTNVEFSQT